MTDTDGLDSPDEYADYGEVVDGPSVSMDADSLGGSGHVRTLGEALDGDVPVLLMHREARHFNVIPMLVDQLHNTHAASLSLGVVVNLPRVKPSVAQAWLSDPCAASVRIAEPELYSRDDMWGPQLLLERDGAPRAGEEPKALMPQRTTPLWDYWNREIPNGPTLAWVDEIVDAQRQVGANLLLTPGLPLDQHRPAPALEGLLKQIDWARTSLATNERLAVNVTIESSWLGAPTLRTHLLNAIVESDEDTWYIRVKWPNQPSYSELIDTAVLDGYRELSAVMEDEERVLLLPNSGGTGWVSVAWGAVGFGTGIGSSARGFTTGRPIRRKDVTAPPPRYYEKPLLHSVEKTTADALARIPGYTTCACMYCDALRNSPNWDAALHGSHYLLAIGEQSAALARRSGRRGMARRLVRSARRTRDKVSNIVPLIDRDSPSHLDLWEQRLL